MIACSKATGISFPIQHALMLPRSSCGRAKRNFGTPCPYSSNSSKSSDRRQSVGVQGPSRLLNHAHSLTVARMVSLPSQISAFCALAARSPCICSHLRVALGCAQQPTGLTLPSGALRVALPPPVASAHRARASLRACRGLGQSAKALCRSIFHECCERPKDARNAAFSKFRGFSTV